jgi:hypothetical protein
MPRQALCYHLFDYQLLPSIDLYDPPLGACFQVLDTPGSSQTTISLAYMDGIPHLP